MTRKFSIISCAIIFLASHSYAEPDKKAAIGSASGSLALTTDYVDRGVSNSNNKPALQGSLTYTFLKTGLYASLWASNCYQIAPDGEFGTLEIDTILGVTNDIGEHFTYNFSLQRYNYPKANSLDYVEALLTMQYYFVVAFLAYSDNVNNVHAPGTYYNLGVTFDVPQRYTYFSNVTFAASIGYYQLPPAVSRSYNDYAITITKKINKTFSFSLGWTDTDDILPNNSWDESKIIGTLIASF